MSENYCALALCIFKPYTPEEALAIICGDEMPKRGRKLDENDVLDMIKFLETKTYQEVGDIYGMTRHAIFKRVKYYKMKHQQN